MRKNILRAVLPAAALLFGLSLSAQPNPNYTIKLYPEGQSVNKGIIENGEKITLGPGESNGLTGPETISPEGYIGNVNDDARLLIYIPEGCNGQMVVMCPGGGYSIVSSYNEGTWAVKWFLERRIAVCTVIYRLPNFHHSVPLTDVQNAFRYCRHHAEEWGIRQIGVMGYSAGGHLASTASTHYTDEVTRPDFSILIYPVITCEEGISHDGTRMNLTKGDPVLCEKYSNEKHVTKDTPDTFLAFSSYDGLVPEENSLRYYKALLEHKVPCEMYVFPYGGHGWGFRTPEFGNDTLGEYRDLFSNALEHYLRRLSVKD